MNIGESIKSAFKNVFANKTRAFLTMLGIIIGIGSVIMITAIGTGSTSQVTEQLNSLGVGQLTVMLSSSDDDYRESDNLTMDDYEMLAEYDQIEYISPTYSGWGTEVKLLDPKETKNASITGVVEEYKYIDEPTLLYGRYITDNDVENMNKVIVINDTTAEKVFGSSGQEVLGQRITIKTWRSSVKYTVVGITENQNSSIESMYGDNYPEQMIMPITTLMKLFNEKYISDISVVVVDENNIDAVSSEITTMLDEAHGTTDKYYVQNIMQQMDTINDTLGLITTFVSAVAGISLVVGGIGVMNIMLVTVTERTREIGIRKSIGAKNKDIRMQFIIEAIIITGIGGVLGLILGAAGGSVAGNLMGITALPSVGSIILAVGVSTLIGLIFGVYPANKAARLNPIEALRYE